MDLHTLLRLIEDDDQGLLEIKHKSSEIQNAESRLVNSLLEINNFIRETGREPQTSTQDIWEFRLHSRLNELRKNEKNRQLLQEHDELGLLAAKKTITSLKEIFDDDDLEILNDLDDSIFHIQHIPKEIATPDYIAQRIQCQNFNDYEHFFKECHADLASGKRKLIPFTKEQQIDKGDFFVLNGIMTYVDFVGEKEISNGKKNARLRCIFENGTESNMLLRSLARELYKNGKRITFHEDRLVDELRGIVRDDKETGHIYILKSHSQNTEIQSFGPLYKIGFSRTPIEERIRNADKEPTFLMAPVSVIASYKCYNLNPQAFELRLHTFFAKACLDLVIFDRNGQQHAPREWFAVPLQVINEAVELLISGASVNYQYDHLRQKIVDKD